MFEMVGISEHEVRTDLSGDALAPIVFISVDTGKWHDLIRTIVILDQIHGVGIFGLNRDHPRSGSASFPGFDRHHVIYGERVSFGSLAFIESTSCRLRNHLDFLWFLGLVVQDCKQARCVRSFFVRYFSPLAAPRVSAAWAPRWPMGSSGPSVVSLTVCRSISASNSAPSRIT